MIIRLDHVVKMLPEGVRAVNGVSLCVPAGERVLVHGAPGSGKSVLMRLVAGMDAPSDGEIHVLDEAMHAMDADAAADFRNTHMGVMLRKPCLLPRRTVLENAALPLAIRGMPLARRNQAAKKKLKALGFGHMAHVCPGQLTPFQAQAASLARALITEPSILLLDEIFAGLTARDSENLAGIIDAVIQFGQFTVVAFSASDRWPMDTDRYIELDHGMIREDRS